MHKDTYPTPHPAFKWNGKSRNKHQLLALAEEYSQTGEDYKIQIGRFFKDWFDGSDFIEVQTSGSTGKPKPMRVKKQYMVNSARATRDFFGLPAGTTALLCLPATYIAGKLMIVRAMVLGWALDSVRPQSNPLNVNCKAYDFCAVTPYQLEKSLEDLELVGKFLVGGGALPLPLRKKVQNIPSQVYESYAMTETLTHIAARPVNIKQNAGEVPPFKTLKAVKIWQDDRDCLVINAPQVSDDIIYTNDIVDLLNESEFYLKGRYDHIINSGGVKIQPEVVEQKLSPLIKHRFFVSSIPDNALGEKIVLCVERTPSEPNRKTLAAHIENLSKLDRYEIPKVIFLTEHFIETHSGKIKRQATLEKAKA